MTTNNDGAPQSFGTQLKAAREAATLTHADVIAYLARWHAYPIDVATLEALEADQRRATAEVIERIADPLTTTVQQHQALVMQLLDAHVWTFGQPEIVSYRHAW